MAHCTLKEEEEEEEEEEEAAAAAAAAAAAEAEEEEERLYLRSRTHPAIRARQIVPKAPLPMGSPSSRYSRTRRSESKSARMSLTALRIDVCFSGGSAASCLARV